MVFFKVKHKAGPVKWEKKCIKNTVLKRIPSDMEVAPPPFNRFSQLSNYKRLKIKVTKMEYFIGFAVHYFPPVKETPLFNISSKRDQVLQISLDQCFECTWYVTILSLFCSCHHSQASIQIYFSNVQKSSHFEPFFRPLSLPRCLFSLRSVFFCGWSSQSLSLWMMTGRVVLHLMMVIWEIIFSK